MRRFGETEGSVAIRNFAPGLTLSVVNLSAPYATGSGQNLLNFLIATEPSAPAAKRCYAIAAQQGIPIAQFALADMLMHGDNGVAQDRLSALGYLRSSAGAGFLPAQVRLAEAYEYAEGTPSDLVAAESWYQRPAEGGSASAQYRLSSLYYHGRGGVPRDWPQSLFWLNLALRQGYGPARQTMETLLESFRRGAEDGNRDAQNMMGVVYENGVSNMIVPDAHRAIGAYRAAGNLRGAGRLCAIDFRRTASES